MAPRAARQRRSGLELSYGSCKSNPGHLGIEQSILAIPAAHGAQRLGFQHTRAVHQARSLLLSRDPKVLLRLACALTEKETVTSITDLPAIEYRPLQVNAVLVRRRKHGRARLAAIAAHMRSRERQRPLLLERSFAEPTMGLFHPELLLSNTVDELDPGKRYSGRGE
jgi:hypothetical protein